VKSLIALTVAFIGFGLQAQDLSKTNDLALTTKVVEFDSPTGGHVPMEETFRGKERILAVMTRSNSVVRMLCLHGKPRYSESDEDGDGFFESVRLPGEWAADFEEFTRQPDGTLKPLSTPALKSLKRQVAAASESLSKLLDNPDMTREEIADLLETNRQKIEAIKKEPTDQDQK